MPKVLYETATNRVIQDDAGNVVVVPVGIGPAAAPAPVEAAAAEPVASGAPVQGGFLPLPPGLSAPAINPGPLPFQLPQPAPTAPPPSNEPAKPEVVTPAPPVARLPTVPAATAGVAGAVDEEAAAIEQQATIAAARANELKGISDAKAVAARTYEIGRQAQEAADQARGADLEKKYADAVDAAAKFNATPADKWGGADNSRKAIALIGVALSGFGSALMGQARNPALDALEAEFGRNIQSQMAQGAALERAASAQATVADRFAALSKSRQGQYQLRMANAWEGFARMAEASAAKYNAPEAIANGQLLASQARQRKAVAIQQAAEGQQRFEQEERHFATSTGLQRAGLGLQARSIKQADEHWKGEMKLRQNDMLLDAAKLEQAGRLAEAKAMKEEAAAIAKGAIGGAPRLLGYGKDGQPLIKHEPLMQDDGRVFTVSDDVEARALRKQKAATDFSIQMIDDVTRLIDENGWSSDLLKSDEWQAVQQKYNALLLNEKERANLGAALTENELKILQRSLGVSDPTAMERLGDPTTGIRGARAALLSRMNADLIARNYTGPEYDIPEMTRSGVEERTKLTPIGELGAKAAVSIPGGGAYHSGPEFPEVGSRRAAVAAAQQWAEEQVRGAPNPYGEQGVEVARARAAREAETTIPQVPDVLAKISVSQRQAMFALAQSARAGDPNARATLEVLASNKDKNVAAAARGIAAAIGVPLQGLR